jgi:hypothetical protein
LFVVEVQTKVNERGDFTSEYLPFVAGYKYEKVGTLNCGVHEYANPPCLPVLFALTSLVECRQVSVGFALLPKRPGMEMEVYLSGHITPSRQVALPETDVYRDLDIPTEVAKAQVTR